MTPIHHSDSSVTCRGHDGGREPVVTQLFVVGKFSRSKAVPNISVQCCDLSYIVRLSWLSWAAGHHLLVPNPSPLLHVHLFDPTAGDCPSSHQLSSSHSAGKCTIVQLVSPVRWCNIPPLTHLPQTDGIGPNTHQLTLSRW